MDKKIKPNDYALHIPTGEEWTICGVDYSSGKLIPNGYPFPSIADIDDCKLIKSNYEPQTQRQRNHLKKEHLFSFIDVAAALLDGDLFE